MDALCLLFRDNGWSWGNDVLTDVVTTLFRQGVVDPASFIGLDINDVEGAETWPPWVSDFVVRLGSNNAKRSAPAHAVPRSAQSSMGSSALRSSPVPVVPLGAQSNESALCLLTDFQTQVTNFECAGPRNALKELKRQLHPCNPDMRAAWRKKARVAAVMGSCPDSLASFKAGVRHWIEYIEITHGPAVGEYGLARVHGAMFPPLMEDILGWSNTFRHSHLVSVLTVCDVNVLFCQVPRYVQQLFGLPAGNVPGKRI